MKHGRSLICALAVSVVCACPLGAFAGSLPLPLYVYSNPGIVDEFDQVLEGSLGSPGDVVQVLMTVDGIINAPGVDGNPTSANNVVLETSSIGQINVPDPGILGLGVDRITGDAVNQNGAKVFVRVFNAPSLANASFYGDSQIFAVDNEKVFAASITASDQPLDPADNDNDGLINSYEKSLNTNPNNPDTDGDGMNDNDEFRAGTDGLDGASKLVMTQVTPSGADLVLKWQSVPGKTYRIEHTEDDLKTSPAFTNVTAEIVAALNETETTITNGLLSLDTRKYRVRLIEP